jgi:DNA-binding response OmpR family regulator
MNNENNGHSVMSSLAANAEGCENSESSHLSPQSVTDRRRGDRRQGERRRLAAGVSDSGRWRAITLNAGPGLWINFYSKEVLMNERKVALTPKEFDLLCLLAAQPGRVYSDNEILRALWTGNLAATTSHIAQYVHRLRKKLGDNPADPHCLVNVKGFGYKLNCEPGSHADEPFPLSL